MMRACGPFMKDGRRLLEANSAESRAAIACAISAISIPAMEALI